METEHANSIGTEWRLGGLTFRIEHSHVLGLLHIEGPYLG